MDAARKELRKCYKCGCRIPAGRLEAMPSADTCVKCSDARPLTSADVEVDGPDDADVMRSSETNGNS